MPVLGIYSLTVELLDDNQVWQTIPVQSFSINETDRDVITKFSFRTLSIYSARDLLTLNRKVRVTEGVDGHTHITTGRILEKPKRDLTEEIQTIMAKCVDDAYEATRLRFIDSWPKEGVRTWDAIVKDAWILHGPPGITFGGVEATNIEAERITSDLEALYDFMEKVKSRTGWIWKVIDGDLKFYNPSSVTEPVELRSDTNIRPGVQVEENMPDVANVVFIPARNRIVDFEDIQNTAVGQEIYRMQYEPLNRSFQAVDGLVEIDQPPEIYLWNGTSYVAQTTAEDGTIDAATAQAVYNVENRWVKLQPTPVTEYTDGLKVIYTAEIPVLVRRENSDSIQIFGEIHHRIVQTPRPTRNEAEKMADQYLKNHAFPVQPMSMEIMEFHIHAGYFVRVIIPDFGIDQLMPVVKVDRNWTPSQGVRISITLNRAPVQDDDLVIDIFNRLNKLENRETSRRERLERYWSWSDVWSWQEEVIRTMHPCPFPSNTLAPDDTLLPC